MQIILSMRLCLISIFITSTVSLCGSDSLSKIQASPNPKPISFAMNTSGYFREIPEYPTKVLDLGVTMCRIDAAFSRIRVKEGDDPDKWIWDNIEDLRPIKTKNPSLEFLITMGYGTKWAEDPQLARLDGRSAAAPRGVQIFPVTSPENLYGHFTYEIVQRYKEIVKYWEPWNEPDLPNYHYFKGNGHDYFPYQKACYLAAKEADPNCVVLFAGICFPSFEGYLYSHGLKSPSPKSAKTSFFEEFLQECAKDRDATKYNYYFDIMNHHSYSRATDLYDYVTVDRLLMKQYLEIEKPIWITEMGANDVPGAFGSSPDEYCDYLLQSYAWAAMAGGVERLFYFQLDNHLGHGLYEEMIFHPKPALTTYRDLLVKEFTNVLFVKQIRGTKGVDFLNGNSPFAPHWKTGYNLFEFRSIDNEKRIYMAFSDTSKDVVIKIPAQQLQATLIDRHNKRVVVRPENGNYELNLPGATNIGGWPAVKQFENLGQPEHLVGGATMIVIEKI